MNTRNPMLPLARRLLALPFVLGLLALPLSLAAAATHKAESRGISEPPFLSYGVKSNLLLLLDNSGSMLDMAEGGPAGQCFDDGYLKNPTTAALDPSREYAGYFKPDSWYVWRESYYTDAGNTRPYLTDGAYPTVAHWAKNTAYSNGALVIDNGVFFKASCSGACTSSATAANISEDNLINWLPATDVYAWEAGSTYPAGSYVKHKSQFYYLQSPTTGSFQSKDDPATDTGHWQPVNYTWLPEKSYTAGTIVTYNGMVFRAATASQKETFDFSDWERLDEGYFEEVAAAPCTNPSYTHSHTSGSSTVTDLQITMVDANGNKITDTATQTPAAVTCFAARGNFLNWAAASKFDVQKKILTGGKYHAGYEDPDNAVTTDNGDDRLVSEHRGCAGTGYVKQVAVSNGTSSHLLTLRVRGPMGDNPWIVQTDDRVDTTDNTTRIEILAVSTQDQGFDVDKCLLAAQKIEEAIEKGTAGATFQKEISDCLNYGGTLSGESNSTNVNSLIECTQYWAGISINVSNLESHCKKIYGSTPPGSITPWDPEYICYGVYNPYIPLEDREGYFGACWALPGGTGTCTQAADCNYNKDLNPGPTGRPHRCSGKIEFQCPATATYRLEKNKYICEVTPNTNDGWVPLYKNATGEYCTYDGTETTTTTGWVDDTEEEDCTRKAADKFCGEMKVPEVIDPSDKFTTTSETYNLPAMLIDAGVMGQLNTNRPLAVLKGYIKQAEKPQGILHATAGELRIGAMAFNSVGSATEGSTNPYIERFSPPGNKDGAELISEIKLGSAVTDDNGTPANTDDDRTHVDDLATAINAVRATSWTPLAEAMYNAIGYYTQNPAMRIDEDDFPVDPAKDPITHWCQSNNILLITEGASTADINAKVKSFVMGTASVVEGTTIVGDGDTEIGTCGGGLDGSTYLDDLTHHGQHATAAQLYPAGKSQLQTEDEEWKDKQNITTYIVATGTLTPNPANECDPAKLIMDAAYNGGTTWYNSTSPEALEQDLLEIFNALRQRSSSGSAASVISSARGGEGAIYQAIFWPEIKRLGAPEPSANNPELYEPREYTVNWTGDVHALFVDARGYMYEDTDGDGRMQPSEDINDNGILDPGEDRNGNGVLDLGDKRVIIYYDEDSGKSKACYNTADWLGTCPDTPVDLHHVRFIWSAGEWLSQLSDVDVSVNRSPYLSDANRRYIYTWNDLNNDGIVDRSAGADNEWLPFVAGTNWRSLPVSNDRNPVPVDFDVVTPDVIPSPTALPLQATADAKVDDIVNWIRGIDRPDAADLNDNGAMVDDGETPRRSRLMPIADGSATKITARLGDVIHSTPMTVSSPAEGYHLIYNDFSYAEFVKHYKNRRHVIYFGGNDGMLHAVNGGFYDEKQKKFCTGSTYDSNGLCEDNPSMPALGAELWAYVPYNLLPHLGSLTQPDYKHKYFVDLRPRIFDAQIFPAGTDTNGINHPNGWGTILVGGMRLGGAPIEARELNGSHLEPDDKRQFISAYFIFDITDPEQPPVLLGEMTRLTDAAGNSDEADLGHSLAIPTMVVMKQNGAATQTDTNKWYLLFGSGPQAALGSNKAMKAVSDQNAKVAVLPLDWLVKSPTALRIPSTTPTEGNPAGTFELLDAPKGFTSDLITVDLDINPSSSSYYSDAVYFGTVEGDFAAKTVGSSTYTYWNGGGRAYRLITRNQESGKYLHGKGIAPTITAPHEWAMTTLLDAGQPVSATPNVGYDGNNFWVYFGTGRFFDVNDKTDDTQQSYYGIKEPMEATTTPGVKEWLASAVTAPLATAHGAPPTEITARTWPAETAGQGEKGLLKVDEIRVAEAGTTDPTRLSCRGGGTDCLPPSMVTANATKFTDLVNYLAKPDPSGGDPNNLYNSADGWYVDFFPYGNRERNVGQATLFGGLVTFTTYQPFLDACQAEGKAYLYALQYQTGTAWTQKIFGEYGLYEDNTSVREKLDLGRGLATTPNLHVSGDGDSVTAMVQTSTGVIEEIKLDNMATDDYFTGRAGWKECSP